MRNLKAIFPRLYPILPNGVEVDITLSAPDSPVESDFSKNVVILYGEDQGTTYDIILDRHLKEMNFSREQLHELAVQNLTNTDKEIRIHPADNYWFLTCDGDLEASLILHGDIWDYIASQVGGEVLAAVPARDKILISGIGKAQVSALKKKASECLELAHRPISSSLLLRVDGKWIDYPV